MGRKRKDPDKLIQTIGAGIPTEMVKVIDAIAARYEWTRAQVSGKLIAIGLAAYYSQDSFDMPALPAQNCTTQNEDEIVIDGKAVIVDGKPAIISVKK